MNLDDFPENVSFEIFKTLEDPRIDRQKYYSLEAILVMSVCATLCDCDTWVDIADFAKDHQDWFSQFLDLSYGVPSHDTFGRVFALINPDIFEGIFVGWVQKTFKLEAGEVIAIDGKTMRGTQRNGKTGTGVHMVSAWATQMGLALGQIATQEKSNEITAIPKLLEKLDLKGCTVTLDAMGCQKTIVEKIREKKGDYCIAVKGNQGNLHEELQTLFNQKMCDELKHASSERYAETIEKDHGRIERREYYSISAESWVSAENRWDGCRSVIMVVSERILKNETSTESRFYISSHLPNASTNGKIIRQHWAVESAPQAHKVVM